MFKSSKPKFDSKVRFQHRTFIEKLKAAQEYKRAPRKAPETEQEKLLSGLGLDSWWSRVLVGLGILLLIYIVYIPNFLFIKQVEVSGADGEVRDKIVKLTQDYFKSSKVYAPQRNVMFLDPETLTEYLLSHDTQIQSIIKVTKDLGKLDLAVELKQEKFELVTPNDSFILYNDGSLSRNLVGVLPEQKPSLIKIQTQAQLELRPDKLFFSKQTAESLVNIQANFPTNKSFVIDYFELPVTDSIPNPHTSEDGSEIVSLSPSSLSVLIPNELVIYTKTAEKFNTKPFKIYFDASSDMEKAMTNFNALVSQLSLTQLASLAYIDMRFPDRSFTCQTNSPCAIKKVLQAEISESSDLIQEQKEVAQ
jgi:hypothetical protein